MSGLLESFARTAEQVAATTRKLEKAALVGAYLNELTDADLARAARYFAGHQFAMRNALSEATSLSVENLRPRYVRLGDSGEVAFEAILETRGETATPSFDDIICELLDSENRADVI